MNFAQLITLGRTHALSDKLLALILVKAVINNSDTASLLLHEDFQADVTASPVVGDALWTQQAVQISSVSTFDKRDWHCVRIDDDGKRPRDHIVNFNAEADSVPLFCI